MPANTDLLKKLSKRWTGQIGAGGVSDAVITTIPLSSTTNLVTDTAVLATVDRVDINGTATPNLEESVIGVVSGSNLISSVRGVEGTAQAHAAGAVVEILVTAKGYNDIVDHLLVGHTQLGVHTNALVTTLKATGAVVNTGTSDVTIVTPKAIADSYLGVQGGWSPLGACTYEASDDPTYTFSFASDMTGILSVGMRIKLTDSTVQCFIVTAVGAFSGGKTIITGYGGTDYNLSGGAITLPYYSVQKAPFGFSLDPTKWTVEVTDTTQRVQATPTQNVWYNLGSMAITVPIGCWKLGYQVQAYENGGTTEITIFATLSTANNSESNVNLTYCHRLVSAYGHVRAEVNEIVSVASKTTYYLNTKTSEVAASALRFENSVKLMIIRAVCAYL